MADTASARSCPKGANPYIWKKEDSMEAVARRYGVTEADIRRINPALSGDPEPGERICVPALRCPEGTLYVVHKGDTFTSIAKKFGITVARLSDANPFVDPDVIAIGQVLCVPVRDEEETPPVQKPEQPEQPENAGDIIINNDITICIDHMERRVVLAGESYADLLIKSGLSYLLFHLLNPALRPGELFAGQEYFVPQQELCCAPDAAGQIYILGEGEDLQTAARRLGVSVGALLRRNPGLAPADFVQGTSVRC